MESFRENVREASRRDRLKHRESTYDRRRRAIGVDEIKEKIGPQEVTELAFLLKNKKEMNLQRLLYLKQAFIQNEENITAFLKSGTLYTLVRELSGRHESLQLAAAGCCCNLSLGSHKQCLILTKAISAYLLAHLDGFNLPLIDTCVWTLGNLAGSGIKSWSILHDQGLGAKLTLLISSNCNCIEAIIYSLTHYVRTGFNAMTDMEMNSVATSVLPLLKEHNSVYWLIYLLSCSPTCDDMFFNSDIASITLQLLSTEGSDNLSILESTALLRILGNCTGNIAGKYALKLLENLDMLINTIIEFLSTKSHLCREVLWLIGNIVNHPCVEVQNKVTQCYFQSKLNPYLVQAVEHLGYDKPQL